MTFAAIGLCFVIYSIIVGIYVVVTEDFGISDETLIKIGAIVITFEICDKILRMIC